MDVCACACITHISSSSLCMFQLSDHKRDIPIARDYFDYNWNTLSHRKANGIYHWIKISYFFPFAYIHFCNKILSIITHWWNDIMLIISKYALKCVLCILSAEAVGFRLEIMLKFDFKNCTIFGKLARAEKR